VSLTGSDAAGRRVASIAGEHLKRTVLELGGSDAFVVLEDADLDAAVATAVRSRFMNAGQSCIAAKRFIVVDAIAEAFVARLRTAIEALVPGDPLDPKRPWHRSRVRIFATHSMSRWWRASTPGHA
jgi:acyl-CoA reductase-like NAD-dependent aldehyde dehydrogenase